MPDEHLVGAMTAAGGCVTAEGRSAGRGPRQDSVKRRPNSAGFSSVATADSTSRPRLSYRGHGTRPCCAEFRA